MVRPTSVKASSVLLFAVAGITLLEAAIELAFVNTRLSVYRDAYTGDTGSGFASIAGATLDILFAAGVSILAILNGHGRNNARVVTLVLGGIFLFCGGLGKLTDRPEGPAGSAGDGTLARVIPAGYGLTVTILDLLIILLILATMVLLALPPSNRFFLHRRPAGHPPYVGYPQPAQPFPSQQFPANPQFFSSPAAIAPPPQQQPPHTTSIPATDPWATPQDDYYRPRHQENPPTAP